jgi:hypothetical protein
MLGFFYVRFTLLRYLLDFVNNTKRKQKNRRFPEHRGWTKTPHTPRRSSRCRRSTGQHLEPKSGIKNRAELDSLITGGISSLIPAFSAITLADRLLSDGPEERRKNSSRFIEEGYFRKFGITGKVAPQLLAASLSWMESDAGAEEHLLELLKSERKRLSKETEARLRPILKRER